MTQHLRPLFLAVFAALLLAACTREPHAGLEPITGKKALSLSQTNAGTDTTWRIKEFWYTINGQLRPVALYTYDSTGRLSHLTMNSDYSDLWHVWSFDVRYCGNHRYFLQNGWDTTLTVTVDSLGRATSFTCKVLSTSQPIPQQGYINYIDSLQMINYINRTINGVPNNWIFYWNAPGYEPLVKTWAPNGQPSISLNYKQNLAIDTAETNYAFYDELDKPDEFPLRIMRLSSLVPYHFKRKIVNLAYAGSNIQIILTDHVIDNQKKLLSYKWGEIQYSLNWEPVP
ncbi:hypothetical protein SAMN05444266_101823 [Chitinophaga jiangningensis]|uniref:YD repeat-containing protein n=1 Tax=Chitinophaga jiangningensis TaxID=1419482 RepID=A0A1M6WYW2_9BACT|nr:hypothetical protein [Chitinophaga jiangningensis]SHK98917.1 hypothetical protein SAMN05444266_101823 [Chitinophaga jiangningensis]